MNEGQQIDESTKQSIRTNIRKIAKTWNVDVVEIVNCTVDAVNKSARTCDVTPISGRADTQIKGVGLMPEKNDGELRVPTIGSTVGIVKSTMVDPYVVSWSDLEEWYLVIGTTVIDVINGSIKFGDGSFNGLVKIQETIAAIDKLQSNIGKLGDYVQTAINVYSGALDAGVSAAAFGISLASLKLDKPITNTMENKKITHGTP